MIIRIMKSTALNHPLTLSLLACLACAGMAVPVKSGEVTAGIPAGDDFGPIRGLIRPVTRAVLSSEIQARIIRMPYKNGDRFNKDDILVSFDCSLYRAELAAAKAENEAKSKNYQNRKELLSLNAISDIEVEIAKAEAKKAEADVEIAGVRVNRCTIKAPYDGRVIEVLVNEHESVSANRELLSILDDRNLEIELILPSRWLGWLKTAASFDFLVDETGKRYPAKVSRIGAAVDPVSQTVLAAGVFESPSDDILSGMSGTAFFEPAQ